MKVVFSMALPIKIPVLPNLIQRSAPSLAKLFECTPAINDLVSGTQACQAIPYEPDTKTCELDSRLGYNWGYGHTPSQYACQDASGKPVTFLWGLNWTHFNDYNNCYSGAAAKIVRVFEWDYFTPKEEIEAGSPCNILRFFR